MIEAGYVHAPGWDPQPMVYTHHEWQDIQEDLAKRQKPKPPFTMSEANAKALHAHWRKVNRIELGLLGLYLARERAWGHAMIEGLRRG